jgi:hypothetical protein
MTIRWPHDEADRQRSQHRALVAHAHSMLQVLPVRVQNPIGCVSVQYGSGGAHGSRWQQTAPPGQPAEGDKPQPEREPEGQFMPGLMVKQAEESPQQGTTQYWAALHVVLPQLMGPSPPLLTLRPPVALLPPAPVEPPGLLEPESASPPVLTLPSLAVPLHAVNTKTRSANDATPSAVGNCMPPHVATCVPPTHRSVFAVFAGDCAN